MFRNRHEAGAKLAEKLQEFTNLRDLLVLALPRGGVCVGHEIARRLHVPLDVFVTRKLGFPGQPELAIGAVSETGHVVLNQRLADEVPKTLIEREVEAQKEEISRRVAQYRGGKRLHQIAGKMIFLVDDGLATGATAKAAVESLRREGPQQLIVAVPVAPESTALEFEELVDKFVCLRRDPLFHAVGAYYLNFDQVTDEEVAEQLKQASQELEKSTGVGPR